MNISEYHNMILKSLHEIEEITILNIVLECGIFSDFPMSGQKILVQINEKPAIVFIINDSLTTTELLNEFYLDRNNLFSGQIKLPFARVFLQKLICSCQLIDLNIITAQIQK